MDVARPDRRGAALDLKVFGCRLIESARSVGAVLRDEAVAAGRSRRDAGGVEIRRTNRP